MAIYRTYECPACKKHFDFLHHPNDEPPPSFCPLCGADVSGKKKRKPKETTRVLSPEKVMPKARSTTIGRTTDALYRKMETSASERMQDAAALLGCDASSLSGMKMTNMSDNLREGDFSIAQSHEPAPATSLTGGAPMVGGLQAMQVNYQQKEAGAEYAKSVGQGPSPFAGNKTREMVSLNHDTRARQMANAGRLNKKS